MTSFRLEYISAVGNVIALSVISQATKTQKAHPSGWALHLIDAWQFPTLTWGDPRLPSALRRFTSEFGMGSGGTTALLPPGKFCYLYQAENLSLKSAKTSSAL